MKFLTISFYAGIALLLLCIAILVTPLGKRFSGATQRIQGFGLNLEVSVMTLLVLISVGLIASGIWVQLQDNSRVLTQLQQERHEAKEALKATQAQLENERKQGIVAFAKLDGVDDVSTLDLQAFFCSWTNAAGDEEKAFLEASQGLNKLKIIFLDLKRESVVRSVTITNTQTREKWINRDQHRWLQPELVLKRE